MRGSTFVKKKKGKNEMGKGDPWMVGLHIREK